MQRSSSHDLARAAARMGVMKIVRPAGEPHNNPPVVAAVRRLNLDVPGDQPRRHKSASSPCGDALPPRRGSDPSTMRERIER